MSESPEEGADLPPEGSFADLEREAAALEGEVVDNAAGPQAPGNPPSCEVIAALLDLPGMASVVKPALTVPERDKLAQTLGAVVDKWFPDGGALAFLERWKEEIALIGCVWGIVSVRKHAAAAAAAQAEAARQESPPGGGSGESVTVAGG